MGKFEERPPPLTIGRQLTSTARNYSPLSESIGAWRRVCPYDLRFVGQSYGFCPTICQRRREEAVGFQAKPDTTMEERLIMSLVKVLHTA